MPSTFDSAPDDSPTGFPTVSATPAAAGESHHQAGVESHAGAEFFCLTLEQLAPEISRAQPRVLIAGCGAGHEAALIQRLLDGEVNAVDVEDELNDPFRDWPRLTFQVASVCDLPFDDDTFDAIFYHHVIEHVDDPRASLNELARVLKPGAWMFVGTPNRHRLISSVGAHRQTQWEATIRNKLGDNLRDWSQRLRGRFRNEFGAHAGFSRRELSRLLVEDFDQQKWLTREYLKYKYSGHRLGKAVSLVAAPPMCEFTAPSIYVFVRSHGK